MVPAIEFSVKHNIKPHMTLYKLEELPKMMEIMVRVVTHITQASLTANAA
jgi:hypothetical protein